jgi:polysaccharide biosynthesis protein PslG
MSSNKSISRSFAIFLVVLIGLGVIGILIYQESLDNGGSETVVAPPVASTSIAAATSTAPTSSTSIASSPSKPAAIIPSIPASTVTVPIVAIPFGDIGAYQFGIATGDTLPSMSNENLNKELNDIASLGIGWIRLDMAWNDVQSTNSSTFNWTNLDRIVAAANARRIKILPTLAYTPSWARSSGCSTSPDCIPYDPTLFTPFVRAAVQRYAPKGITAWEIWNEPNITGSWKPTPDAAKYTIILKEAYTAIKSVEPSSTVISGGLSPAATGNNSISPIDFLTQMYADGAGPYFDAVGMHPYSYPAMPSYNASWNAWQQMSMTTPSLRSIMIANGDANKKIWMTEYGAPTGGPGILESSTYDTAFTGHPDHVTETLQSQMIAQAMTLDQSYPWAGPLFIYSYKDLGTSTSTIENYFGIIRFNGSVKPAYTTIKELVASGL